VRTAHRVGEIQVSETDPHERADELEREADDLARADEELRERIEEADADWQRKRADESVPGANPPDHDDENEEKTTARTDS
jgi:hypothetical protein